jgi:hypothetical protein
MDAAEDTSRVPRGPDDRFEALPEDAVVEHPAGYRPGGYYALMPGHDFDEEWVALRKLGDGLSSTTWLVLNSM